MSVADTQLVRTFIAVEIPAEIKARMAEVQAELRKAGADVGWVRPEGVHLTLKFLGGIPAESIDALGKAVEEAARGVAPFTLEVKGIGVFPNSKAPRVVWLGLGGDMDALAALHEKIEAACEPLGFAREERPFNPHLTLGRVKTQHGRDALMRAVARFENVEAGIIRADAVSVMKSELMRSGAVYTEMRRIGLG
ncbi:MAG: RNA 2',3'-cyclic phosphodiesterase [Nitrospirae bacterium]|nr:RNA 2',3'-cyclic phosphodiesterase [Nitrospirota bacterium]